MADSSAGNLSDSALQEMMTTWLKLQKMQSEGAKQSNPLVEIRVQGLAGARPKQSPKPLPVTIFVEDLIRIFCETVEPCDPDDDI